MRKNTSIIGGDARTNANPFKLKLSINFVKCPDGRRCCFSNCIPSKTQFAISSSTSCSTFRMLSNVQTPIQKSGKRNLRVAKKGCHAPSHGVDRIKTIHRIFIFLPSSMVFCPLCACSFSCSYFLYALKKSWRSGGSSIALTNACSQIHRLSSKPTP